jgi:hypothetical protein
LSPVDFSPSLPMFDAVADTPFLDLRRQLPALVFSAASRHAPAPRRVAAAAAATRSMPRVSMRRAAAIIDLRAGRRYC